MNFRCTVYFQIELVTLPEGTQSKSLFLNNFQSKFMLSFIAVLSVKGIISFLKLSLLPMHNPLST